MNGREMLVYKRQGMLLHRERIDLFFDKNTVLYILGIRVPFGDM